MTLKRNITIFLSSKSDFNNLSMNIWSYFWSLLAVVSFSNLFHFSNKSFFALINVLKIHFEIKLKENFSFWPNARQCWEFFPEEKLFLNSINFMFVFLHGLPVIIVFVLDVVKVDGVSGWMWEFWKFHRVCNRITILTPKAVARF